MNKFNSLKRYNKNLSEYFAVMLEITNLDIYSKYYDIHLSEKILKYVYKKLLSLYPGEKVIRFSSDKILILCRFWSHNLIEQNIRYTEQYEFCKKLNNTLTEEKIVFNDANEYYTLSVKIGCASCGLIFHENNIEELIKLSQFCLIKSKELSKSFTIADEKLRIIKKDLDCFNAEMENGISFDEFNPYFMPVINLETMKIESCESLVRWNKDSYRIIEASKFQAIALEKHLFKEIDKRVCEKTFQVLSNWKKNNLVAENFYVTLNISNSTINDINVSNLIALIKKYNLTPEEIEFDIQAETGLNKKHIKNLKMLKKAGFKISYDAMNLTNISLSLLSELKFNSLKFNLNPESSNKNEICNMLIKLSKVMNFTLTAKHIENSTDIDILGEMKIKYAEGFYFTKPLDMFGIKTYLNKYKGGYNSI